MLVRVSWMKKFLLFPGWMQQVAMRAVFYLLCSIVLWPSFLPSSINLSHVATSTASVTDKLITSFFLSSEEESRSKKIPLLPFFSPFLPFSSLLSPLPPPTFTRRRWRITPAVWFLSYSYRERPRVFFFSFLEKRFTSCRRVNSIEKKDSIIYYCKNYVKRRYAKR